MPVDAGRGKKVRDAAPRPPHQARIGGRYRGFGPAPLPVRANRRLSGQTDPPSALDPATPDA